MRVALHPPQCDRTRQRARTFVGHAERRDERTGKRGARHPGRSAGAAGPGPGGVAAQLELRDTVSAGDGAQSSTR
eukprot:5476983-Prymnesium_polylepis.1